ncbi:hypothetical protein HYV71_05005 [Candidatus Uhrbacteria bacterium]|nr:hypothetical protein [Candidatus Uhrbacteria bacterium]
MRANSRSLKFPKAGEPFELSSFLFDPLELVEGEDRPEEWRHTGVVLDTPQVRIFRSHISSVDAITLDKARAEIAGERLVNPEGQWLRAFKHKYPVPPEGDQITICIADPSWIHPDGDEYFPCLDSRSESWDEGVIGTYSLLRPGILWIVEEE